MPNDLMQRTMTQTVLTAIPLPDLQAMISMAVADEIAKLQVAKQLPPDDTLIKIDEVCKIFGVSKVTVHQWKKEGKIPFHRIGKNVYFRKDEVLASLNKAKIRKVGEV